MLYFKHDLSLFSHLWFLIGLISRWITNLLKHSTFASGKSNAESSFSKCLQFPLDPEGSPCLILPLIIISSVFMSSILTTSIILFSFYFNSTNWTSQIKSALGMSHLINSEWKTRCLETLKSPEYWNQEMFHGVSIYHMLCKAHWHWK